MNILFLLERKSTVLPWFLCPNHHQLCSAAPFPCSKARCWGIIKFNIKIPVCCWWNITCMITSGTRGEQRPSPAFFIPAKPGQGCPAEAQLHGESSDALSKVKFLMWIFTDKIHGENKNLDMASRVKMWPGTTGGSYRKRWSSSEGALYQGTHLGKGASKGLEEFILKGRNLKMRWERGQITAWISFSTLFTADSEIPLWASE